MIWSACGWDADRFYSPGGTLIEAAARILPGCGIVGLQSAICPPPLPVRDECHIGLDLDPVCPRGEDRHARQIHTKSAARDTKRLAQRAINLRARQTGIVRVEEDIETVGRSRAVEVPPIGIYRLYAPSLTCRNNKIIGQIGTEGREVGESR